VAFEIEWMEPARRQLREIANIIRADNPAAAEFFAHDLRNRVNLLRNALRLGAAYRRRSGFEVRHITFRKYRYRVRPRLNLIEVLSVWHGARREPRLSQSSFWDP